MLLSILLAWRDWRSVAEVARIVGAPPRTVWRVRAVLAELIPLERQRVGRLVRYRLAPGWWTPDPSTPRRGRVSAREEA